MACQTTKRLCQHLLVSEFPCYVGQLNDAVSRWQSLSRYLLWRRLRVADLSCTFASTWLRRFSQDYGLYLDASNQFRGPDCFALLCDVRMIDLGASRGIRVEIGRQLNGDRSDRQDGGTISPHFKPLTLHDIRSLSFLTTTIGT